MKILHVTIDNPQISQGGLNRYCNDLMESEDAMGHNVSAIYPGKLGRGKKVVIKKVDSKYFTIHGALPVAITYGIDNPERYMVPADMETYKNWLTQQNYDIIHVHSIQGIHKELFLSAKDLRIPMIFTTHDYYPICMKCNLVNENNKICEENRLLECHQCNASGGLGLRVQMIRQSKIYKLIKKQKWCMTALRYAKRFKRTSTEQKEQYTSVQAEKYSEYNAYRKEILDTFTLIHCNSLVAEDIYKKFLPDKKYMVIPITHAWLNRIKRKKKITDIYNIGFMGGTSRNKGYDVLENALEGLANRGIANWITWFYGGDFQGKRNSDKKRYNKYFSSSEESNIWNMLDILVVPSQCYETFGFVVLEALCHGIPVICSNLVGSKYLIEQLDEHLVFHYNNVNSLTDTMECLLKNIDYYNRLCKKIETLKLNADMDAHTDRILEIYSSLKTSEKIRETYGWKTYPY